MGSDPLFARFGREYPAGHVLFREGEPGSVMYVIQSGRVRITRVFATGERALAILGPGDFFGEMAILNQKPRAATATTLDELRALEIDARTLEAMVLGNPEIAVRLITRLARRLDSANAFAEILLQPDPRVRVILALARESDEVGQRRDDGTVLPITAGELARSVGLTEREVESVLRRLVKVRVVSVLPDGAYLVPDEQKLHEFVEHLKRERPARASFPSRMPAAPRAGS